jgi:hypothetical protein
VNAIPHNQGDSQACIGERDLTAGFGVELAAAKEHLHLSSEMGRLGLVVDAVPDHHGQFDHSHCNQYDEQIPTDDVVVKEAELKDGDGYERADYAHEAGGTPAVFEEALVDKLSAEGYPAEDGVGHVWLSN